MDYLSVVGSKMMGYLSVVGSKMMGYLSVVGSKMMGYLSVGYLSCGLKNVGLLKNDGSS